MCECDRPCIYCEKCAPRANQFLEDEEKLRVLLHEKFREERAALVALFSQDNFKLPDVPT